MIISIASSISLPISLDIQNRWVAIANRATALSAYTMIIDIFSAGVNLIIGKASSVSMEISFFLCGIMGIIALLLIIYYFKLQRQEEA